MNIADSSKNHLPIIVWWLLFGTAFARLGTSMTVPFKNTLELMLVSYLVKLVFLPLAAIPSSILVQIVKKIEDIDVYDKNIDFNPFKLSINS